MKTARKVAALFAVIAPLMLAGPAQASPPSITATMAQTMVDAAARAAQEKGFSIVISIVDNHGNLKHFHRMDNTSVGSIEVSRLKASTSAQFPVSTKVLAERSAAMPANPYTAIPGFLLLEGGLPVMSKSGMHIGGIGISGATPELDGQFAQAAIDQLNQ
ncbi:hypothetical protein D3C77_365450 [compost metagenome]|uniref:GlcG/HbpS family heme-binding protein n=1 Tax=Pseudomonas TaxID=286 RepID=UPI00048A8E9F|nr:MULTISPECIES: heme-binding protein [Pseudomonas]MCW2269452.1 uncharacterized protein GlcG (DUF336 family) [Pseudomonas sp. JUb96]